MITSRSAGVTTRNTSMFGDPDVGYWECYWCGYFLLPWDAELRYKSGAITYNEDKDMFACPECEGLMDYEEYQ